MHWQDFKVKLLGCLDDSGIEVHKESLTERYTVRKEDTVRVVDIYKQYGKYQLGVDFDVLVQDILDKLEPNKNKGIDRDRNWLLRNVTLGVLNKRDVTEDIVHKDIEGTELVLVVTVLDTDIDDVISSVHSRFTWLLLENYKISFEEIFEAAKCSVMNSSIETSFCADDSVHINDSVSVFLPDYMNSEFGEGTWYIVAYTYEDIRVYRERDRCREKSIFDSGTELCNKVIKYNNGKYEQED